jgi:hypothetical protein
MAQETTTLNAESGASYVYDVYMSDTQEGIFGADITPDSVLEMSFQAESEATSEPIEKGGFASFYKTNSPETVSLVFSFSADDARQNTALDKIRERKENYDLISILTPTHLYENMTIISYSYNRTNTDGMTMLVLQVDFQQIKQVAVNTGVAVFKNATSAKKKNTGKKQKVDAETEAKVRRSSLEDAKKTGKNVINYLYGNN